MDNKLGDNLLSPTRAIPLRNGLTALEHKPFRTTPSVFVIPASADNRYTARMSLLSKALHAWQRPDGRPAGLSVFLFWLLNVATVCAAALGMRALEGVPRLGFAWKAAGTNLVVAVIEPNGPASGTGLSSGDRLLSLNGIPLNRDDALIYPEINRRKDERAWWSKQQKLYETIRSAETVVLGVQKGNRHIKVSVNPQPAPLREILGPQAPLYTNAALHILLGLLVFGRARGLAQLLCAFLSVFMALNYVCFVPLSARNPALLPDAMHWLVLGFYIAAGGNITLIHFSLIFPKPKKFLVRLPILGLVPYLYFAISVVLYATGAIAFGSTFPFLVFWVLLMIGALIHTMLSQSDPFLRQQSLLTALAPLYVGLFYVLLTLLPTVLRDSANDYALYASVTLILPFTLAFAAETTELYGAMRREEAAVQAERLRISRDLHDSVGGDLTAIKLFAEEAEVQQPEMSSSARGLIQSIRETANRSLTQVRGFIWAIDPRECNWSSFARRLEHTGKQLFRPLGIDFSFACGTLSGIAAHPHLLYQIMGVYQEALNNILKHAGASAVQTELQIDEQGLRLSVRDNGKGRSSSSSSEGYGSRSMRERAASIGATVDIGQAKPNGTEITLRLAAPAPKADPGHPLPSPPAEMPV